ncbi:hypothetical protein ILUMI_27391 [Ignelater luminosus]|uniref:Uncharacterized protein n=1 Tax=Ignelater luminosus TaxID=2038154 RepID=A0A8K0C512_IGNLU|nr:hypothetical protein ILUMI_27391 [Ignelater luminosus]
MIAGAKGKQSSRTTSSSGRENTTDLSAVSASRAEKERALEGAASPSRSEYVTADLDAQPSTSRVSFEDLLLNTVKQISQPLELQKRRRVTTDTEVITSTNVLESASSGDDLICINSDKDCKLEMYKKDNKDDQQKVAPDKWGLVKYCTEKRVKQFVGQVIKKIDEGYGTVDDQDVVQILPEAFAGIRGNYFPFHVDFACYNL